MSYPKKLLRLRPRRGAAADLPAWSNPVDTLDQADNLVFRQGVAERPEGFGAVYDPPTVAPYIIRNVQIADVNYWVYCGATASYVVTGSTHTEITHASGQSSQTTVGKLSLELLNQVPIFNNSVNEPMYWDGQVTSDFVTLPDWTATESCEVLVPHRFHLFAMNIDGPAGTLPEQVKFSDAAAPGNVPSSWTPAATNEAGSATLSDTPGPIISGLNLRSSLAIYKQGSTHLADYIGGDEIFSFRTLFSQLGALSRHAVTDVNGSHLVVTDGDIVLHDGQTPRSIAQNRRKRFLFNQLDQDNFDNLFVTYWRRRNEVWICFPEAGQTYASRAMVYDVANDAWGDRELANIAFAAPGIVSDSTPDDSWDAATTVWDSTTRVWNTQTFSLAEQELVLADQSAPDFLSANESSESLTSTWAKNDIDFNEPERIKYVRRLYLRVEAASSIDFTVRIGTRDSTGGSVTYTSGRTINSDDGYVNVSAAGKYISVEVATTTTLPFKITGLDLEAEIRGYH